VSAPRRSTQFSLSAVHSPHWHGLATAHHLVAFPHEADRGVVAEADRGVVAEADRGVVSEAVGGLRDTTLGDTQDKSRTYINSTHLELDGLDRGRIVVHLFPRDFFPQPTYLFERAAPGWAPDLPTYPVGRLVQNRPPIWQGRGTLRWDV